MEELKSFNHITSHDLQEPLGILVRYAQLFQIRYENQLDTEANEFISFMVDAAKRMKKQIHGLFDYSHIGTNIEFKEFKSEEALETALLNLNSLIKKYNAEITYNKLPLIKGDASKISIVFQNLIENALKFHKEGVPPKVHIFAEKKNKEYVFCVSDNGIGIQKEFTDQIFDIFKRLHVIGKYEGVGIGLALCKKIIELHGGHMWSESKLGKSSKFYFTIPFKKYKYLLPPI